MIEVYKEQINDLEEVVFNFKIANATIHFDESSPHLHIVVYHLKMELKWYGKQIDISEYLQKLV